MKLWKEEYEPKAPPSIPLHTWKKKWMKKIISIHLHLLNIHIHQLQVTNILPHVIILKLSYLVL